VEPRTRRLAPVVPFATAHTGMPRSTRDRPRRRSEPPPQVDTAICKRGVRSGRVNNGVSMLRAGVRTAADWTKMPRWTEMPHWTDAGLAGMPRWTGTCRRWLATGYFGFCLRRDLSRSGLKWSPGCGRA
jgi:hypothetical protein